MPPGQPVGRRLGLPACSEHANSNPSMTVQTKELEPGQYCLDRRYARARFTTPYFAQFLTDVKQGAQAPTPAAAADAAVSVTTPPHAPMSAAVTA